MKTFASEMPENRHSAPSNCSNRLRSANGDNVRLLLAHTVNPGGEASGKIVARQGGDDLVEGVVGWDAAIERQEAAKEIDPVAGPAFDLDEIVASCHGRA